MILFLPPAPFEDDDVVGSESSENRMWAAGSLCGSSGSSTDRSQLKAEHTKTTQLHSFSLGKKTFQELLWPQSRMNVCPSLACMTLALTYLAFGLQFLQLFLLFFSFVKTWCLHYPQCNSTTYSSGKSPMHECSSGDPLHPVYFQSEFARNQIKNLLSLGKQTEV